MDRQVDCQAKEQRRCKTVERRCNKNTIESQGPPRHSWAAHIVMKLWLQANILRHLSNCLSHSEVAEYIFRYDDSVQIPPWAMTTLWHWPPPRTASKGIVRWYYRGHHDQLISLHDKTKWNSHKLNILPHTSLRDAPSAENLNGIGSRFLGTSRCVHLEQTDRSTENNVWAKCHHGA